MATGIKIQKKKDDKKTKEYIHLLATEDACDHLLMLSYIKFVSDLRYLINLRYLNSVML